jgi:hypothetical protein
VGQDARQVLAGKGIGPDFAVHPEAAQTQVDFIHRRTGDADIYFVRNVTGQALAVEAQFRVKQRRPELWYPDTGKMLSPAVYEQREEGLVLPLQLPPHGSLFVIFSATRKRELHVTSVRHQGRALFPHRAAEAPGFAAELLSGQSVRFQASTPGVYELVFSDGATRSVTVVPEAEPLEVTGPWEVRFPQGWVVPVTQEFARLYSWTDSTNTATQSFSGTATYARQFHVPGARLSPGQPVRLDLGDVREAARVYLNGKPAGSSVFAPHVLDVTGLVRPGENSLVVEVANTWLNRLRADDALPEAQRKTHTNLSGPVGGQRWRDAQPKLSGLLGPVRLVFPRETTVDK